MNAPTAYRSTTSTLAGVSLGFGIAAWVLLPFIGAIVAVICGHLARAEIRHAPDRLEGDGLAIAGLILGYVQLAFAVAALVLLVLVIAGLVVASHS